ncbi:LysR family transcriptional regulator [Vibrio sp. SCSIO 43136]|uniref:LysR family transcriptional regulator n=1 Tax=Vibrio sp. SCSIO 43136 TaxID=2819101 RepID=UPI00207621B8|nr:LysR family transcriptional regulator [Vibrio sp. SCSIO 43136]USD65256.1 LysR family transcriptional regulator [Vibrio sp. SCSIO 43136]
MNIDQLMRIDLNLLVCLNVLIEEQSVTRAGARLCLSQSAVSKSLAKLRELFDDPLFYRTSQGLKPSPKCLYLQPKLKGLIHHLEDLTQPQQFDPATSTRQFNVALVESVYPLILPHFIPDIFAKAPQIRFTTHAWSRETFRQLQSGDVDLGITGKDIAQQDAAMTMLPPKDIRWKEIYRDDQVCLVRKDHPLLSNPWTLETYLKQRHVQVRCDGNDRWLLDYRLADAGLERDIAMYVPDFNSAASLCTYTDLVFTAPRHFCRYISQFLDLTLIPLPTDLPPMAYTLFWHQDRENDPALSWLRDLIQHNTEHLSENDQSN